MHPEEFKLLSNVNPSTTVGFFTVPISGKRKIKSIECFFNWSTVQPSHTGKFVCDSVSSTGQQYNKIMPVCLYAMFVEKSTNTKMEFIAIRNSNVDKSLNINVLNARTGPNRNLA
ncbi:hypothetical protein M8J77_015408 [Diaphorina citri]|nr:hypothetical protein M8J77_015408 [Diaphorina citri]